MKSMNQKKHIYIGVGVIIVAILLLIVAAVFTSYIVNKKLTLSSPSHPPAPDLPIHKLTGKVTRINQNGRDFMLNESGETVPGPGYGLADTGDSITVDDQSFSTSNAGPSTNPFFINIDSIRLGDTVHVYYELDSNGHRTLNCKDCTITK